MWTYRLLVHRPISTLPHLNFCFRLLGIFFFVGTVETSLCCGVCCVCYVSWFGSWLAIVERERWALRICLSWIRSASFWMCEELTTKQLILAGMNPLNLLAKLMCWHAALCLPLSPAPLWASQVRAAKWDIDSMPFWKWSKKMPSETTPSCQRNDLSCNLGSLSKYRNSMSIYIYIIGLL